MKSKICSYEYVRTVSRGKSWIPAFLSLGFFLAFPVALLLVVGNWKAARYTPDQLHAAHIKMALEAGKHVICTKPLMVDLDEAGALLEAQKRTGKTVFVGQSSRYFEPARRQRQDFEEGRLGGLITVETHYISDSRWFLDREWSHLKGFSWMYNFMIHAVDLAVWYLPEVEEVYGLGIASENTRERGIQAPDTMKFLLKNKDGRFAGVNGVYAAPTLGSAVEQSISCTLRGTKGISRAGYPKLQYYTNFQPLQKTAQLHEYNELHDYFFRFEAETHHAGEYQNYIEQFARDMNEGITPKPDLKEGIRTLAVMEAMEQSLRLGISVKVSQVLADRNLCLD